MLSNFPQTPYRIEARLRIELLEELLRQKAKKRAYPVLVDLEIKDTRSLPAPLSAYLAQGFNTLLVEPRLEKSSDTEAMTEMVSTAHQAGFYLMAPVRVRPMNLDKKTHGHLK